MNHEIFLAELRAHIEEAVKATAEPIVKKAIADIEANIRSTVANKVVGLMDSTYSVSTMGNTLRIEVLLPRKP